MVVDPRRHYGAEAEMKLVVLLQCNKVAGNSCSRLGTNRGRCGMVVGMSISRRLTAIALAGALTLGGTTAANAQENPVEKLTSQAQSQIDSAATQFISSLPQEVKDTAHKFGIKLPSLGGAAETLRYETVEHLEEAGHTKNNAAQSIAQKWANEAAAGKVSFKDGVGHGTAGTDEGTGAIFKLTEKEARDRTNWLDRKGNPHNEPTGFGVATATDGKYVYISEFFLN